MAILARGIERAEEAAEKIAEQHKESSRVVKAYQCDVSNVDEIKKTLDKVNADFGSIDVVVNDAAILDTSKIDTLTEETWDKVIDINLKGVFFMVQAALPYLEKSKNPRVINISSNSGRMGGVHKRIIVYRGKGRSHILNIRNGTQACG